MGSLQKVLRDSFSGDIVMNISLGIALINLMSCRIGLSFKSREVSSYSLSLVGMFSLTGAT